MKERTDHESKRRESQKEKDTKIFQIILDPKWHSEKIEKIIEQSEIRDKTILGY